MKKKRKLYGKSRTIPALKYSIDIISWIKRGKMRAFVFSHITERTMPSEIVEKLTKQDSKRSGSHYAQISRAIAELEKQGIIKCLNPKEKTGRLYSLTKKGMEIKEEVK